MKRRFIYGVLGILVASTMVMVACQPAQPTQQGGKTVTGTVTQTTSPVATTPTTTPAKTTQPAATGPKYGGTLTLVSGIDPLDFDQAYKTAWQSITLDYTNEPLVDPDWTKGPAGTKEIGLGAYPQYPDKYFKGASLESWDLSNPLKWVFRVRKGAYFHNKPPVNGREMVADDVAVTIRRMFSEPGSWLVAMPIKPKVSVQDKYTVILEWGKFDSSMWFRIVDTIFVVPKELVRDAQDKENQLLRDWKNACGTGPFMLVDWVKGSSVTFQKNPNYWGFDPFNPQNRLPYIDKISTLIIPDPSTSLAALRTAKLDVRTVVWADVPNLDKSNPELRKRELFANYSLEMTPRTDVQPFDNKKVRQALSMAINRDVIMKDLMGGHANYLNRFFNPFDIGVYTAYENLPANIKETLTYNPDKAKKLLAEAGYPNGFQTSVMYVATNAQHEEVVSLIKADWEKIGVKLTLDPRESAVFTSVNYARTFPGLQIWGYGNATALNNMDIFMSGHYSNIAGVKDAWWDQKRTEALTTADEAARNTILKEISSYALEQMYVIPLPSPSTFLYWQPWINQYEGSYMSGTYHYIRPFRQAWIDQDLRFKLTGKR
ncbi:MAG: ABC transporter substrate-binding protein [Dehalococcoidia bacterium]|nr:ABC transporter substrate-binding protein [Dehalococcoidia bacterium]